MGYVINMFILVSRSTFPAKAVDVHVLAEVDGFRIHEELLLAANRLQSTPFPA
jgi:hypothetical protein